MTDKIKKIRKRDGKIVYFDQSKITEAISKALLASNANKDLAESISDKVVALLEKRFADSIPQVEQIQNIVEEVLQEQGLKKVAHKFHVYRQKRSEIRKAKWWLLDHQVKTELSPNALQVLEARYLRKNDQEKIIETPQELFKRVAQNIASAEKIFNPTILDEEIFRVEETFFRMMASLEFLPNSPTLMNAGNILQQLSACFVLPVPDSIESIFGAIKQTALIHQSGGGTGFSFSRLRPRGDIVHSTKGIASGPISFMTVFDAATDVIKQGGKRRGANMGILKIDHPDILEFITAKQKEGVLSNFNISVAITDKFMEKLKKGQEYGLINPRNGQIQGSLDAKHIFDLIVHYAWVSGDPGVIFIDQIDAANPTPMLGKIESTNPCGEQPLLPYESCNLGSINLSKMIKAQNGKYEVDWQRLSKTVRNAVHFLDNVIDVNRYPLPEIEKMTKGNRKIGLGIMGFADMLILLGLPYNSSGALRLAEKLMKFIDEESKIASVMLAEKRGVFPNFQDSIYNKPGMPRVRNATTTTIAPTGTISIIADCSFGIEPLFAVALIRRHNLGGKGEEMTQINPLFKKIAKERKFYSDALINKILSKGSIQEVEEIPQDVRRIFTTTFDISPSDHVRIQSAFQKYVDNAVSKTINFPFEAVEEEVRNAYLLAYKLGCKGITIFRNGSRKQQILNLKTRQKQLSDNEKEGGEDIPGQAENTGSENVDSEMPYMSPGSCPKCNL